METLQHLHSETPHLLDIHQQKKKEKKKKVFVDLKNFADDKTGLNKTIK